MPSTVRELDALLEPLERLDRLIASTFRRFGPKLVDLSYANPADGPAAEVLSVLRRVTGERAGLSLQYTPTAGRTATRRAVAAALAREYGLPFRSRDVIMTSGAMPALNAVFRALFGPDDEVIVLTPAWQDYPLYLRNLSIPISFVGLRADKRLDLDAIGRAIGHRTRGVLLSQPCCPTGVVYSQAEITRLSEMLRLAEQQFGAGIYLISDEVHRQMIWGADRFFSPLHRYDRSLSIYSFGKALSLQGQRIGYVAVSPQMPENEDVSRNLERCLRAMGFGHPTSLMQYAVCDLLDFKPPMEPLARRQACVRRALTECGYEVCDGGATFYVYVKSPIADDFRFAELLAARGVLVVPGVLFHDPGYIRLSLTARTGAIAASLPAFARVRDELGAPCHA
jgi:aspartate aminotransferase